MNTPTDLICTRLADMFKMHPAQIERSCSKCGQLVGIYPSGQKALKKYPKMKITCSVCASMRPVELVTQVYPAGTIDEIIQETRDSYKVHKV